MFTVGPYFFLYWYLILSRLHYDNGLLLGSNQSDIQKLQRIQNWAAKLICRATKQDHASPYLPELRWLSVEDRITFKIFVFFLFIFFYFPSLKSITKYALKNIKKYAYLQKKMEETQLKAIAWKCCTPLQINKLCPNNKSAWL